MDDATDAAKAVSAAKDLIGQSYKIIIGTTSSGNALQLAPLAEQNRILYISGPAAVDAITGANRYTFRSGRQSYQDTLAAKEILGRAAGRKITVFAQDTAFGQGNVAAVRTCSAPAATPSRRSSSRPRRTTSHRSHSRRRSQP